MTIRSSIHIGDPNGKYPLDDILHRSLVRTLHPPEHGRQWPLFPTCVPRVPISLWGLGLEGVFARRCVYVRNRPPPFATVHVRVVWPCHWQVCLSLCDIQTCFLKCQTWVCVARAILLTCFLTMIFILRGRRSTLDVYISLFRGRRNALDVSSCVFVANHIVYAVSSGDKVQFLWHARHFRDVLIIGRSVARNVDLR